MAEHKQPSLRKAVGQSPRDLRERAGYSQEKLANLADVHRTYVGRLE